MQMNTPRVAVQETKKGFRNAFKRQDLMAAMTALCNLKGVGPALASGTDSNLKARGRAKKRNFATRDMVQSRH